MPGRLTQAPPRQPSPKHQTPRPPSGKMPLTEVRMDVGLALVLAGNGRATGPAVAALRDRLVTAIIALEPEATAHVAALKNPTERAAHTATIRQAITLAESGGRAGPDSTPEHSLSLLGKAADVLGRLAHGHRHRVARAEGRPLP
ncbi:hypothetical protein FNQ90_07880 [Streptomyces alkaliphilus]|uniref:Uncharacterized protein n=1 Tax=Streptomyces alkaliphilus TaxID=1472722 RepID=A0A7W3Y195_9ACTN|nr:hypothetical protein [Streptomyces alkaliphilus]MBB0244030.1 hypothetical protein [Streptomyces alkaliphilus]